MAKTFSAPPDSWFKEIVKLQDGNGTPIWDKTYSQFDNDDRNALGSVAILDNQDIVAAGFHRNSGTRFHLGL